MDWHILWALLGLPVIILPWIDRIERLDAFIQRFDRIYRNRSPIGFLAMGFVLGTLSAHSTEVIPPPQSETPAAIEQPTAAPTARATPERPSPAPPPNRRFAAASARSTALPAAAASRSNGSSRR